MNWPHAPRHWLFDPGLYMVTAGTAQKLPHLNTPARRDFFLESLFARAVGFGWELRAWAVLANHYHFVAASPPDPANLNKFIGKLHMQTAGSSIFGMARAGAKSGFNIGTAISTLKNPIWPGCIMCRTIRRGTA